jgi:hypothetical protein
VSPVDSAFAGALRLLGRVLVAAQPFAGELLVIGGMVPVLYRQAPGFVRTRLQPPGTTEVDFSVPPRLSAREPSLARLLEAANLVAFDTPGYRDQPGTQCFQDASHGTERKAPNYVEFLAPLRGKGERAIVEIQPGGVRAEALRYLDLLAFEPIELDAATIPELEVQAPCRVRVPQPALYVAQKILARSSGRATRIDKSAKDLAYTYDVAALSRPLWDEQAAVVARAANESPEWKAWLARAGRELRHLFATPESEGPVSAARVFRDLDPRGAPAEQDVRAVVSRFVETVLRLG